MKKNYKSISAILLASCWISFSEFVRNEFLLKSYWIDHYQTLGLVFPSSPANGAVWGIWALVFAISIYIISRKFTLIKTTLLAWIVGFVMMWLVIGNMGVLPLRILIFAVPSSLLETFIACFIIAKISGQNASKIG